MYRLDKEAGPKVAKPVMDIPKLGSLCYNNVVRRILKD